MKAAARLLLIVTLMVSIGAHWGVLQVVAWAQMVKSYSSERGLVQGLQETFDGEHPCAMCQKLQAAKAQEEQKQQGSTSIPTERMDKVPQWFTMLPAGSIEAPSPRTGLPAPCWAAVPLISSQWDSKPVTPPPRSAV